jgi:hypothetical protein
MLGADQVASEAQDPRPLFGSEMVEEGVSVGSRTVVENRGEYVRQPLRIYRGSLVVAPIVCLPRRERAAVEHHDKIVGRVIPCVADRGRKKAVVPRGEIHGDRSFGKAAEQGVDGVAVPLAAGYDEKRGEE